MVPSDLTCTLPRFIHSRSDPRVLDGSLCSILYAVLSSVEPRTAGSADGSVQLLRSGCTSPGRKNGQGSTSSCQVRRSGGRVTELPDPPHRLRVSPQADLALYLGKPCVAGELFHAGGKKGGKKFRHRTSSCSGGHALTGFHLRPVWTHVWNDSVQSNVQ